MAHQRTVMISGADGFLGSALSATFAAAGWQVYGLIRNLAHKKLSSGLSGAFDYAFPDRIDPAAFQVPVDLFVHSAFVTHMTANTDETVNVTAARFLLERFRGARFVFISSMSAHPHAYSRYGLEKLATENLMDPRRDLVIRPGFIVGYGGVFRRLAQVLSRLPVVPLFYGGSQPIHTVHVDDVCRSALRLVEGENTGVWPLGEDTPLTIRSFYGAILSWIGKRPVFLPIPGSPSLYVMRLVERCGIQLPMTSENLLGLKGLIAYDVSRTIDAVGFRPASFSESVRRLDPAVLLQSQ